MAFDPCQPCDCIPANIDDRLFHQMALNALCGIIAAVEAGGGGGGDVNLTEVGGEAIALGQAAMAASLPVTLASDQPGLDVNVAEVGGAALALGQGLMAASVPVTLASNQTNLPTNITQVAGASIAQGHGLAATAIRVELPTDGTGVVGLATGSATFGSIASITTSITPGTAAANLGKAEDSIAGSGDTGVMILSQRQDTPASTCADGDYQTFRSNQFGGLFVDHAWAAISQTSLGVTGTTITGSFGGATWTHNSRLRYVEFYNTTDRDVVASTDGTSYFIIIPIGTVRTLDLAANGRFILAAIQFATIGTTATTGTLYCSGIG